MLNGEELLKKLEERGLLQSDKIREIIEEAKRENADILELLSKMVDTEAIAKIQAEHYNLPYQSLLELKISPNVLNIFSEEVAENYNIICFDRKDNLISVGITEPENFKAIEAVDYLAKSNNLEVKYFFVSEASFKAAFKKYKNINEELSDALKTKQKEENDLTVVKDKEQAADLEEVTKSAPVAKIVSVIIRNAVDGGASDIHIEPLKNESRVRYRIDGLLHTSLVLPLNVHRAIVARIKVMSNLKLDETRIPQDGRIKLMINNRAVDFRISTLPLVGTEKVVMRVLDTAKGAPKLSDLGFAGESLRIINENMKNTEGMMLVTGPTGSGKSTTLFSVLSTINTEEVNISTLEDPVEYQMKGVNQSQIRPEIGYTFATGLRSFLRQDPDVILVGEIRDEETAELAIHAALTGHSVLSTLHTTSAPSSIARLIDMNIEPFLLGSTLHTIVAQRLVRKICSHCKAEEKVPKETIDEVKKELSEIDEEYLKNNIKGYDPENLKFYKGKGCPRCGNSGYKGRVCIAEVLDVNDKLRDIIKEGKKFLGKADIAASGQNFISVKQDGYIKAIQGHTSLSEIMRVMKN